MKPKTRVCLARAYITFRLRILLSLDHISRLATEPLLALSQKMAPQELTCRLRVKKVEDNNSNSGQPREATILLPFRDCPDVGTEIRTRWANEVIDHFGQIGDTPTSIRSWDFIAGLDGSIESLPTPIIEGGLVEGYPAHFQIPPSTLDGLDHGEKVRRAEKFAMASLLYEIMTGRKPLQGLTDEEVQRRFINGDFPNDAAGLPNVLFILSGWSAEFSQELTRRGMPTSS